MYVQNIERRRLQRILAVVLGTAAFAVIMSGCGSENAELDLGDIGLQVRTDIQAGSTLDVSFASPSDVELELATVPEGVTAGLDAPSDSMRHLTLSVDEDTPRGDYYLGFEATRDGQVSEINWPFTVVEP